MGTRGSHLLWKAFEKLPKVDEYLEKRPEIIDVDYPN